MREDLNAAVVERIVRAEVRNIGRVDGYDYDDLAQEARLAASLALRSVDVKAFGEQRSHSYVRTAVQRALVSTKRDAHVKKRVPHNTWGRRERVDSLDAPAGDGEDDAHAVIACPASDPETVSASRELLRAIDERLDADERAALFRLIADSARALRSDTEDTKAGRVRALAHAMQRKEDQEKAREALRKAERSIARLMRAPGILELEERDRCILRERAHRVDDGARPTTGPRRNDEKEQKMAKAANKKIDLPTPDFDKVSCHGANPNEADRIGYAPPSDEEGHAGCVNCNDKFTCIPASIANSLVDGLSLDTDREAHAVHLGGVALDSVLARLRERRQTKKAGGTVPDHLLMENFGVEEEAEEEEVEETEEEEAEEEATEEVAAETAGDDDDGEESADDDTETETTETETTDESEETTMTTETTEKKNAKKGSTKKAAAKKAPTKKAAAKPAAAAPKAPAKTTGKSKGVTPLGKAAAKKEKPAAATRSRIPADKRVAIDLPGGSRFLPQSRELTPEQMTNALSKVALGQPFDLAIGMQVVRKLRDGSEQVVTIKKNGFEFDGAVYPSLTAAAMWATGRSVNGNTHFNVATNSCTEIRGSGVPGGKYAKDGSATVKAAKKPAATKAAAAKPAAKKAAPAPAPAKAAKKVAKKSAPPPPPPPAAKKGAAKKAAKKK